MVKFDRDFMRRSLPFSICVIALLYSWSAKATHLRAGDITVARQSCDNYKEIITLHVYTKAFAQVKFGGGALNFGDGTSITLPAQPDPPVIAWNDNGGVGDVEYSVTHTYSGPGTYTITYTENNRNSGVLNIDNSVDTPFSVQTQIILDPAIGCDNTPVLLVPPVDQGCTGVTWTHNAGAYDPDGDSLSYSLYIPGQGAVYNAQGVFVSAIPVSGYRAPNAQYFYGAVGIPYEQSNEAGNGIATFSIHPTTGMITWDAPGEAGQYNIGILIKEWRKRSGQWVMLGYVERDMQIIIEDCKNKRPHIQVADDTCVVAGALINTLISATDPDGSATGGRGTGDSLNIIAYSPVFNLGASYTPQTVALLYPVWQPAVSPSQSAQVQFTWQTDCSTIAEQPYPVLFKATDNGTTPLATFAVSTIRVVAPSPQGLGISVAGNQRAAQLSWQPYTSRCANVSSQSLIQVWRSIGSNPFVATACTAGMLNTAGYVLIAEVPITATTYTDKTLAAGATYCYRLAASIQMASGIFAPGIPSAEVCLSTLAVNAPAVTNVTVDNTSTDAGQITVRWRGPFQADKTLFPAPYSYQVLRAENSSARADLTLAHSGKLTDSIFVDTKLNTNAPNIFYYRVVVFSSNGNVVDSSAVASSVRITAKALDKQIELRWASTSPWANNTKAFPFHLIYRGPAGTKKISDLTLIDSVDVNRNGLVYLDSGQYQATPLVEGQSYSYAVMTRGTYGNPLIHAPLLNYSEITNVTSLITGEVSLPAQASLFPNPVESTLKIVGMDGDVSWVQGFDVTGKTVPIFLIQNERGYEADVATLPAGLYLLRIKTTTTMLQFKFIKN
jgi:hypothetical protein